MYEYAYVCMYVCMNVCVHVFMLAITFITILIHSTSFTRILILYLLLCMHTHLCMLVLLVLPTWTLRFYAHLHVVVLVHFICAFTLFSASSIPCVFDCNHYNAFHVRHVSHFHCNIYILHACYSFCFTFTYWVRLHSASFTDIHTHLACMLLDTVTVPYCLVCTSSMVSSTVASNGGHT
jgi:hypothetical protein